MYSNLDSSPVSASFDERYIEQATLAELIYQHATRPIPQEQRAAAPPDLQHPLTMQALQQQAPVSIYGGGTSLTVTPPSADDGTLRQQVDMAAAAKEAANRSVTRQQHSSWQDVSKVMGAIGSDSYGSTTVGHFLITRDSQQGSGGAFSGFGGGLTRKASMSGRISRTSSFQRNESGAFLKAVTRTSSFSAGSHRNSRDDKNSASFRLGASFGGGRVRGSSMMNHYSSLGAQRQPTVKHIRMVPPLYVQHPRNNGWSYSQRFGWVQSPSLSTSQRQQHGDDVLHEANPVDEPTSNIALSGQLPSQERVFQFSFETNGTFQASHFMNGFGPFVGGGGGADRNGVSGRLSGGGSGGGLSRTNTGISVRTTSSANSGGGSPTLSSQKTQTTNITLSVPPPPAAALVSRGPRIPTPPPTESRTLMSRASAPSGSTHANKSSTSAAGAQSREHSPSNTHGPTADHSNNKGSKSRSIAAHLTMAAEVMALAEATNVATAEISTVDGRQIVKFDKHKSEYAAARRHDIPAPKPSACLYPSSASTVQGRGLLSQSAAAGPDVWGLGGGDASDVIASSSPVEFDNLSYTPWFGEVWDAVDTDVSVIGAVDASRGGESIHVTSDYDALLGGAEGGNEDLSVTFNSMIFRRRVPTAGGGGGGSSIFSTSSSNNVLNILGYGSGNATQRRLQNHAIDVKGTALDPSLSTLTPAEVRYREQRQRIKEARRGRRKMASLGPAAVSVYYKAVQEQRLQQAAEEASAAEARRQQTQRAAGIGRRADVNRSEASGEASGQQQQGASSGQGASSFKSPTLAMALGGPGDPADIGHTLRQLRGVPPAALADADPSDFVSFFRRQRIDRKQTALQVATGLLADEQRQKKALQASLLRNLEEEQSAAAQREEARLLVEAEENEKRRRRWSFVLKRRKSSCSPTRPDQTTSFPSAPKTPPPRNNTSLKNKHSRTVQFDLQGVSAALQAHQRENLNNGANLLSQANNVSSAAGSSSEASGFMKHIEGFNYLFDGPTVFTAGQAVDQHTVDLQIYRDFEDREMERLLTLSTAATMPFGGAGGSSSSLASRGDMQRVSAPQPTNMPAGLVESEILVSDTAPGLTGFEKTLCSQLSHFRYRMMMGGRRYATIAFETAAAAEEAERQLDRDAFEGKLLKRRKRRFSSDDDDGGSEDSNDSLLEGEGEEALQRNPTTAFGSSHADLNLSDAEGGVGAVSGDEDEMTGEEKAANLHIASVSTQVTNQLLYRMREQQGSFESLLDELIIDDDHDAEGEGVVVSGPKRMKESDMLNIESDEDGGTKLSLGSSSSSTPSPHERAANSEPQPPLSLLPKVADTKGTASAEKPYRLVSLDSIIEERHISGWLASAVQAAAAPLTAPIGAKAVGSSASPSRANSPSSPIGRGRAPSPSLSEAQSTTSRSAAGGLTQVLIPSPYFPSDERLTRAQKTHIRRETAPFRRLTSGAAARIALRKFEEMHFPQYVAPCMGATNMYPGATAGSGGGASRAATSNSRSPTTPFGGGNTNPFSRTASPLPPPRRMPLPFLLAPPSLASLTLGVRKPPPTASENPKGGAAYRRANHLSSANYSQQQRTLDAMLRAYDVCAGQFVFPQHRPMPSDEVLEDMFAWERHVAVASDPSNNKGVSFGVSSPQQQQQQQQHHPSVASHQYREMLMQTIMGSYFKYCDALVESPFNARAIGAPRPPPFLRVLDPSCHISSKRKVDADDESSGKKPPSPRRAPSPSPTTSPTMGRSKSPRVGSPSHNTGKQQHPPPPAAGSAPSLLSKACYVYVREGPPHSSPASASEQTVHQNEGRLKARMRIARREAVRTYLRAYRLWLQYRQQCGYGENIRTAIRDRALPLLSQHQQALPPPAAGPMSQSVTPARSRRHSASTTPATTHFSPPPNFIGGANNNNSRLDGARSPSARVLNTSFGGAHSYDGNSSMGGANAGAAASTSQLETLRSHRELLLTRIDQPMPLSTPTKSINTSRHLSAANVNLNTSFDGGVDDLNATQRSVVSNASTSVLGSSVMAAPRSPRTHHMSHVVPFTTEPFEGTFTFFGREVPRVWTAATFSTAANDVDDVLPSYMFAPLDVPSSSVYPNLTLKSLADVLTPNLFTATEMLQHITSEIRLSEREAEQSAIPASLSHLSFLPIGNEGINNYGGYGMVGVPLVGSQDDDDGIIAGPSPRWRLSSASPSSIHEAYSAPFATNNGGMMNTSYEDARGDGAAVASLISIDAAGTGHRKSSATTGVANGEKQVPQLLPTDLATRASRSHLLLTPNRHQGPRLSFISPLSASALSSVTQVILPMLLTSLLNTDNGTTHTPLRPRSNHFNHLGCVTITSPTSQSHDQRSSSSVAPAATHAAHPSALTLNGALAVPCTYIPSPLHLLNNLTPENNFVFHAQLTSLSAQAQRQFGRLLILMTGLVAEHRRSFQVTTSPSQMGPRHPALQLLQQLTASTTGSSGLAPNPWSQHVSARHSSHWVSQRKHMYRVGKAKSSIAVQTTLQHDKDYRAMRVTLLSYLATGVEPIARQALLNEERSAVMSIALAHRMVRKLAEVPAFRISTLNMHRQLIRGALEEQAHEMHAIRQHRHAAKDGAVENGDTAPINTSAITATPSTPLKGGGLQQQLDVSTQDFISTHSSSILHGVALGFGDARPGATFASLVVPPPDTSLLATVMLQCGALEHFTRPALAAKTDLLAHLAPLERSAREDIEAQCKTVYERIALQRHIDLQRILADMDVAEMEYHLARETLGLEKLKRKQRRQESMLAIFSQEDDDVSPAPTSDFGGK